MFNVLKWWMYYYLKKQIIFDVNLVSTQHYKIKAEQVCKSAFSYNRNVLQNLKYRRKKQNKQKKTGN